MPKKESCQSDKKSAKLTLTVRSEADIGRDRQLILVCDDKQFRRQLVSQAIVCCGAKPDCHSRLDESAIQSSENHRSLMAVVAIGGLPVTASPALEIIRYLKEGGFTVIAYEDGAYAWPLGVQCQALLAGAHWLLDSSQPDFDRELKIHLSQLLFEEAQRIEADARIRSEMKRLGIIGESKEMASVFCAVMRVSAVSDLSTLITGETGTGKELIARAIHQLDYKRRHGPFVAINCAAVNSGIAESELFGHRRGAFTGADKDRRGLIRSASGGVLFLDEIGELDIGLQSKLLRVLQENRVLGVGDDYETHVDVRVIAATNRNMKKMTEDGSFRADLLHRLNPLSIHVPPLRQRPADIGPLVEHFLGKHAALRPECSFVIGNPFLTALTLLELPGNIRQLENIVRWAMVNKEDESALNLSDLPQELLEQLVNPSDSINSVTISIEPKNDANQTDLSTQLMCIMKARHWSLAQSLEYCEKVLLESTLQLVRGNQTQTAKLLGLTPRSVYNKVRKYQLAH